MINSTKSLLLEPISPASSVQDKSEDTAGKVSKFFVAQMVRNKNETVAHETQELEEEEESEIDEQESINEMRKVDVDKIPDDYQLDLINLEIGWMVAPTSKARKMTKVNYIIKRIT